jgi:hypothetical protein
MRRRICATATSDSLRVRRFRERRKVDAPSAGTKALGLDELARGGSITMPRNSRSLFDRRHAGIMALHQPPWFASPRYRKTRPPSSACFGQRRCSTTRNASGLLGRTPWYSKQRRPVRMPLKRDTVDVRLGADRERTFSL